MSEQIEQRASAEVAATAPVYGETSMVLPDEWLQLDEASRYDSWHSLLITLGSISRSSSWWLGDTLRWGENNLSERYSQAVEDTGMARQTLINYVHVCSHVDPARRRRELSFGHHEAVTMLDAAQQDAWLQAAVDNGWSRKDLRERIHEWRARRGQLPTRVQDTAGHPDAVAAVEAAREQAAPAAPDPLPPPAAPAPQPAASDAQVLAAAVADTLRDVAATIYESAIELEAAFIDQPNEEYMAVPARLLMRLHETLGLA